MRSVDAAMAVARSMSDRDVGHCEVVACDALIGSRRNCSIVRAIQTNCVPALDVNRRCTANNAVGRSCRPQLRPRASTARSYQRDGAKRKDCCRFARPVASVVCRRLRSRFFRCICRKYVDVINRYHRDGVCRPARFPLMPSRSMNGHRCHGSLVLADRVVPSTKTSRPCAGR